MTRKRHRVAQKQVERAELEYLEALDSGDLERLAELWQNADAATTQSFIDLSQAVLDEAGVNKTWEQDVAVVQHAVAASFSPPAAAEPLDANAPLRARDVAARMQQDARHGKLQLTAQELTVLDALLQREEPLPDSLGMPTIESWVASLGVKAGKTYLRAFKDAAMEMRMARDQKTAHLLAARAATPAALHRVAAAPLRAAAPLPPVPPVTPIDDVAAAPPPQKSDDEKTRDG